MLINPIHLEYLKAINYELINVDCPCSTTLKVANYSKEDNLKYFKELSDMKYIGLASRQPNYTFLIVNHITPKGYEVIANAIETEN